MADDRPAPHAHAWAYGDVRLVMGRPMLIQRCACGAERTIRAFERSWQPPQPGDAAIDEERLPGP